jgi:hypothetical protein
VTHVKLSHYNTSIRQLLCLLVLLCVQLLSTPAHARLTGEAELGYVKYDSDVNGLNVNDAHSFQQRYSLLYSDARPLAGGRLGGYSVALGYEWGSFDSKMKTPFLRDDVSLSDNRGHVLYEGEILIDPKELPLRFSAYSRDLNRMQFINNLMAPDPNRYFSNPRGMVNNLINPNMPADIINGTHISSGATLTLGVRNGLTNGYNEIFRYFPMILLDYRDEINKDTESKFNPVDTRLSRFAFVSLNKKDNWFHFRTTRYTDNLNSYNDWTEKAFQIGTVDQNMVRRWIDFSNWIKVSTDGVFTKRNATNHLDSFEGYDFNLFGVASREKWEARTFNTFSRVMENNQLRYDANVPLYITGSLGPETDWRARFYDHEKKTKGKYLQPLTQDSSDMLASLQINTFKRSPFTLTPTLSVEYITDYSNKTLAVEGSVETSSTRRFSPIYELYGRYGVKYFDSEPVGGGTSSYVNQEITGRISYVPSMVYRLDLEQSVQIASGTNPGNVGGSAVTVNSGFGYRGTDNFWRSNGLTVNDYVRSVTTLSGTWSPLARLQVSLAVSEDILSASGFPNDYITRVTNTINYSIAALTMRVSTRYSQEDSGNATNHKIESYGLVSYQPNRNMDGSLNYNVTSEKLNSSTITTADLTQKFNYYLYRTNGVSRRLLEFNEEILYGQRDSSFVTGGGNITKSLTLGVRYYPLQRLYMTASTQYSLTDPGNVKGWLYYGSVGLNYSKLQLSMDYSYGTQEGNFNLKRVEKRFSANMKKFF